MHIVCIVCVLCVYYVCVLCVCIVCLYVGWMSECWEFRGCPRRSAGSRVEMTVLSERWTTRKTRFNYDQTSWNHFVTDEMCFIDLRLILMTLMIHGDSWHWWFIVIQWLIVIYWFMIKPHGWYWIQLIMHIDHWLILITNIDWYCPVN